MTPCHRIIVITDLSHALPKHVEQLRVGILKYRYDIEIGHICQRSSRETLNVKNHHLNI